MVWKNLEGLGLLLHVTLMAQPPRQLLSLPKKQICEIRVGSVFRTLTCSLC